jgi:gluconokinase
MVIIIMGVTGSGKSTVGRLLAATLGWKFYEGDDFHPAANIEKLQHGAPLSDEDRLPWLVAIRKTIQAVIARGDNAVVTCSALKEKYRQMLQINSEVVLIYLQAEAELIEDRLKHRTGHFMNPALIHSQFETLEEPEPALQIDARSTPEEIVGTIKDRFSL